VNFYIFDFFSRTTGPVLTKLGTNHPLGREFKFVQMKGIVPLQGETIAKLKLKKKLLLQTSPYK
jgi:hypothetical protein